MTKTNQKQAITIEKQIIWLKSKIQESNNYSINSAQDILPPDISSVEMLQAIFDTLDLYKFNKFLLDKFVKSMRNMVDSLENLPEL